MSASAIRIQRFGRVGMVVVAVLFGSSLAMADDSYDYDSDSSDSSGDSSSGSAVAETPKRKPATATPATDHDMFVGSFAVGYFGMRGVPIAMNPTVSEDGRGVIGMDASMGEVDAPVVGVRYWLNPTFGLDVGVGLGIRRGSATYDKYERDAEDPTSQPMGFSFEQTTLKQTAFVLHAGLPMALSRQKHYTFQLVPELNVGFSSGTVTFDAEPLPSQQRNPLPGRGEIKTSGFNFDIGVRAGTEVHFGFIGIPNLALQATVGLKYSMRKIKADGGARPPVDPRDPVDAHNKVTYQESSSTVSTTVGDTPWAIFENTISALYYF